MCDVSLDGDAAQVWSETERTARKEYRCDCCAGPIPRGERYVAHRSMMDGGWSSARLCLPCRDTRTEFVASHHGLVPHPEALRETIEECVEWNEESSAKWQPALDAMDARGADERRREFAAPRAP